MWAPLSIRSAARFRTRGVVNLGECVNRINAIYVTSDTRTRTLIMNHNDMAARMPVRAIRVYGYSSGLCEKTIDTPVVNQSVSQMYHSENTTLCIQ